MTIQAVRLYRGRIVQRWDHEPTEYREVIRGVANGMVRGITSDKYAATNIYSVGAGTLSVAGEVVDPLRWVRGVGVIAVSGGVCTITYGATQKTLAEVKAAKGFEINSIRTTKINSGVAYAGSTFDTDDASRANLSATLAWTNNGNVLPAGFAWRSSADVNVPMGALDIGNLSTAMFNHVNLAYATSWTLKAEIEAATTIDEVLAVVWE